MPLSVATMSKVPMALLNIKKRDLSKLMSKRSYLINGVSAFISFESNPMRRMFTSALAAINSCTVFALLLKIARYKGLVPAKQ